jgi:hypothetical protein
MRHNLHNSLLAAHLLVGIILVLQSPGVSDGFDDRAHEAVSLRAIDPNLPDASQLDIFLRTTLPYEFPQGINQSVGGGQTVLRAITDRSGKGRLSHTAHCKSFSRSNPNVEYGWLIHSAGRPCRQFLGGVEPTSGPGRRLQPVVEKRARRLL